MGLDKVGVYAETAPDEQRVALVPRSLRRVQRLGLHVLVETGAGDRAGFQDGRYTDAGAKIVRRQDLFDSADILVGVRTPPVAVAHRFRAGQVFICELQPMQNPELVRWQADRG